MISFEELIELAKKEPEKARKLIMEMNKELGVHFENFDEYFDMMVEDLKNED